jgi:CRISPR-associated protein Cse2 (CRISPR_cse2)
MTVEEMYQPTAHGTRDAIDHALDAIAGLIRGLVKTEASGDLAALRRLDWKHPDKLAFARITVIAAVDQLLSAQTDPATRGDLLRRLALVTSVMASAQELHAGWKLGGALSDIGATERRLGALLTARGDTLLDTVKRTAARLSREGPLPYRQLGRLVLTETLDPEDAEVLRFAIARDFARASRRAKSDADQNRGIS